MNSSITRMLSSRSVATMPVISPAASEHQLRLGQVEVERPALVAALAHELRQLVHALEQGHEGRESLAQRLIAVDDGLDLLVASCARRCG